MLYQLVGRWRQEDQWILEFKSILKNIVIPCLKNNKIHHDSRYDKKNSGAEEMAQWVRTIPLQAWGREFKSLAGSACKPSIRGQRRVDPESSLTSLPNWNHELQVSERPWLKEITESKLLMFLYHHYSTCCKLV